MHSGIIILRDIPKEEVKIDLARFSIQGGFRGISEVPTGPHYVSVRSAGNHHGFWCYVHPGQVIVKLFDSEQNEFTEDLPESAAHFTRLAKGGSMSHVLRPYPDQFFAPWFSLTKHLKEENFPPKIYESDMLLSSRFDSAFKGTHGADPDNFMEEFQYAFLSWIVSADTKDKNERAFLRWRHLLLSIYNAGDRNISDYPELFERIAECMLVQFDRLADDFFGEGSFLTEQIDYLLEDMAECRDPEVASKSSELRLYINMRKK